MVNFSIENDVAIIELDDGKANVFSAATAQAVLDGLKQAEANAKATVIRATGDKFSAGFDLASFKASDEERQAMLNAGFSMLYHIYNHPQPVVAACNGHALGIGAFVLLVADTRIGAEGDYKIGLPETAVGLGFTNNLIAIIKAELAKTYIKPAALQSQNCNPKTAIQAGFLDHLVPATELQSTALQAAQQLMQLPSKQYGINKRDLRKDTLAAMHDPIYKLL